MMLTSKDQKSWDGKSHLCRFLYLKLVLIPYGGKEPVTFDKMNMVALETKVLPSKNNLFVSVGEQEAQIPPTR